MHTCLKPQLSVPRTLIIDTLSTPIGELTIVSFREGPIAAASFRGLPCVRWLTKWIGSHTIIPNDGSSSAARTGFNRYFEGDVRAIDALKLQAAGTEFQRSVWHELVKVRPGQTETYGTIARRIGKPSACRAVGLANGANPIAVPCHRIVGSNGTLTGYSSGIERKRWLLQHELRHSNIVSEPVG